MGGMLDLENPTATETRDEQLARRMREASERIAKRAYQRGLRS